MKKISFEELPEAVGNLFEKLESIEKILLKNNYENNSGEDEFLTIQQAAEVLNLSVPTIYGYVHRLEIPFSKVTKRLYFSKKELIDWVRSARKQTSAEILSSGEKHLRKRR